MAATSLLLRFLGTPEVLVAGHPLDVDTRKSVAVLACLAVDGDMRRDRLAAFLWPDADRSRARGALRRTLSVTAKSLGGLSLDAGGGVLSLPREQADCDLWTFDRLVDQVVEHGDHGACLTCLDALERAVGLRRGAFLSTFTLRGCPEFEEWQEVQEERLRRRACEALDWLVRGHAAVGSFDPAVAFAEKRLALDPLHERTYRQLMLLHTWSGRRSEAVREFRSCVAVLNAELGVSPLDETTALYQRLVDGDVPPPPSARSAPTRDSGIARPLVSRPKLPIVGRNQELRAMLQRLEEASRSGQLVSVEGEAGIGKSRLVEELVTHAHAHGATVLGARCHEDERRLPHAPLIELLRAAFAASPNLVSELPVEVLGEAGRLLPELTRVHPDHALPPLDSPQAKRRFHDALIEILGMPHGSITLIVIDDAHNADRASLGLLTHLARRLRGRTICLVLAWRPESSIVDRTLRRLAAGARDDGWATTVVPQRLSRDDVQVLATNSVPERAEEITDRLYAETEGLPLLVVEYLATLEVRPEDWALPVGARDRLISRLETVRGVARQVLTTAAVIGRSFDLDLVQRASGRTVEDTGAALEQLVACGLVRPEPSGDGVSRWDFGHSKMRQLVYDQASLARRRLLHARVADAMWARARSPREQRSLAALVANHLRMAGREHEASVHHRLAAEHARSLLAFGEAREHLEAALALGDADVANVHEQLGDLYTLEGNYVAALASYETAAANLLDDPSGRAIVEQKLAGVHLRRGDRHAADTHLGAALHLASNTDALADRARILADRSLSALRSSDPNEAQALAEEAMELAAAASDSAVRAQAHNVLALVARRANRMHDARQHAQTSLELAVALGDEQMRVAAMNNLGLIHRASGECEVAVDLLERALVLCRASGDRHREAALANNLADALYDAGRRDEAMTHLKEAVTRFAEVSDPDVLRPEIWKLVDW